MRSPLTGIQKVLMGKGQVRSMKPVFVARPWMGTLHVNEPFDKAQAEENRKNHPHLFVDEAPRRRKAA